MSLVTRPIANLFNGVSQQPASLRSPTQCQLQENLYSSIATGARKRPPTRHVAKLSVTPDSNALVHYIARDVTERYEVRIRNGSIEVWDLVTGTAPTLASPDGLGYLVSATPKQDFSVITVADYTFIVNRTVTAAMTTAVTGIPRIVVSCTNMTATGTWRDSVVTVTTNVAHALVVGDYATVADSTVGLGPQNPYSTRTVRVDTVPLATTFTYNVHNDTAYTYAVPASTAPYTYNGTATAYQGTKQSFSLLPAATGSGGVWKIEGTPDSNFDNYYVKDTAAGVYTETSGFGIAYKIDPATMPHILLRAADGSFVFQRAVWTDRLVGDDVSNPIPSFIGNKISGVFFHRSRLGLLATDNMVLSRVRDSFNFFAETGTAVLDSDPIDKSAGGTKVALLKTAVSFNDSLMLFSDQAQFQVSGGVDGTLTPKNTKLDPVTDYDSNPEVRPAGAGQTLFFTQPKGASTGIREYFVEQDSVTNDAADITAHVPNYISGAATALATSTTEDFLAVLSTGTPHVISTYKYYWTEDSKKLQSAWSNFKFETTDTLMGCAFIGNRLYISVDRADGHYLEYMDMQAHITDGTLPFDVLLDRKVSLTGVYDAGNNWTTWTIPYVESAPMQAILNDAWTTDAGRSLTITRPTTTTVRAIGNFSTFPVWIGRTYTSTYRFSRFFVKDDQGQSITTAVLKIMTMVVNFAETGYFKAVVTIKGRPTPYEYVYSGIVLSSASATLGDTQLSEGEFRFPVSADSADVTIDIVNASYLPCSLLSAEWEAELTLRTKRI